MQDTSELNESVVARLNEVLKEDQAKLCTDDDGRRRIEIYRGDMRRAAWFQQSYDRPGAGEVIEYVLFFYDKPGSADKTVSKIDDVIAASAKAFNDDPPKSSK